MVKYDPFGNLLWQRAFDDLKSPISGGMDIIFSNSGDSYLLGVSGNYVLREDGSPNWSETQRDSFITKFDKFGNRLWTEYLDTSSYELPHEMTQDSEGQIYITGRSIYENNEQGTWTDGDMFIAKFRELQ